MVPTRNTGGPTDAVHHSGNGVMVVDWDLDCEVGDTHLWVDCSHLEPWLYDQERNTSFKHLYTSEIFIHTKNTG